MSTSVQDEDLEELLVFMKANRNFDFTGYKRASLQRRIDKRMQDVGITGYANYMKHLEQDGGEFAALFDTVLINVTAFFRDDAPWQVLAESVIPKLLEQRPPEAPLRVWSAGCASGEEAYTVAMVLCETLGETRFRERVKIYATDVDEAALATARQAVYSRKAVEAVPEALRERYFEPVEGEFAFRKDIRRSVIFGRNDLILDAPISRIDLLMCRNTLMYFNAETQEKILNRFHFALNDEGVLFLGRAETLLTHSSLFTPLDAQRRLFVRAARPVYNDRRGGWPSLARDTGSRAVAPQTRLREAAFDAAAVAQFIFDRNGFLSFATEWARSLFSIAPADIGRPLQDLQISYRPVELRSLIDQAYSEQHTIRARDLQWHPGEDRWFDVAVTPLTTHGGPPVGVSVTFTDVTAAKRLQRELERSNSLLEVSYEELQSTHEEMETTNEELHTVNNDSERRSDEMNQLNAFLESVFASLRGAVAVIDPEMRVLVWNPRAEDMWGLRSNEVEGAHFLNLEIGLPLDQLRPVIRSTLADNAATAAITVDARNRRGKEIRCRISCTQLRAPGEAFPRGVILQMEEEPAVP